MLHKVYAILVMLCCCVCVAMAQAPLVEWQQTVTPNGYGELEGLIETSDGNYVGIGGGEADDAYVIIKLSPLGTVIFQKNIPRMLSYGFGSIVEASDGGYMIGGSVPTEKVGTVWENSTFTLVKLDKDGNTLWQQVYRGGNNGFSFFTSLAATKDGGYVLAGLSDDKAGRDKSEDSRGDQDYWMLKVNAAGVVQWDKTFGGSSTEYYPVVFQTEEGGYMIAGSSTSGISGDKTEAARGLGSLDFWILKLDATGTITWQKTLGGKATNQLFMAQQTADKGYIVGGSSNSPVSGEKTEASKGGDDFWVLKLTAIGGIEWQKTIGGSASDVLTAGYVDSDGGYVVAGRSASPISGDKAVDSWGSNDYWIMKLSTTGNIQWQQVYGGASEDMPNAMLPIKNGSFIVGGISSSDIGGNKTAPLLGYQDYWFIKFKPCTSSSKTALTICPKTTYNFNGNLLSAAGVYNGKFTNQNGCDSLVELTLSLYNSPTPLVDVKMNVLSSINTYKSYQWLLNDAAINAATANSYTTQASGAYRLAVVTENNCMDTSVAYQPVFETNLFVPNMFSPNGDGKNDVLKVYGNQLKSARLLIFDQWGRKVFESANADTNGWDGRSGGKMQAVGVYMYVLEAVLNDGTATKTKGSISLIK